MSYAARFNNGADDYGGAGGFMQGSQANNTPGGSHRAEQALRPVTIKQLLDAEASNTDSTIVIQDVDVTNVSFCGVVRGINRNPTNVLLSIEDGTGLIEVRKWTDSSDGESEGLDVETGIQIHDWVRVIGSPKIFNSKKHVAGLRLEKIEDYNEINYRLLDAVRVTLLHDHGSGDASNRMNIDRPMNNVSHGRIVQPTNVNRNPRQDQIMQYLATLNPPDEGINVHQIARECGLDIKVVNDETAKLINEGELYTTVDDDHVMPTVTS